jgi:hypothetical protein
VSLGLFPPPPQPAATAASNSANAGTTPFCMVRALRSSALRLSGVSARRSDSLPGQGADLTTINKRRRPRRPHLMPTSNRSEKKYGTWRPRRLRLRVLDRAEP